jgi:hypothetical protein
MVDDAIVSVALGTGPAMRELVASAERGEAATEDSRWLVRATRHRDASFE